MNMENLEIIEIHNMDEYAEAKNNKLNSESLSVIVITGQTKIDFLKEIREKNLIFDFNLEGTIYLMPPDVEITLEQSSCSKLKSHLDKLVKYDSFEFGEPEKEKSFREITRQFLTRKRY